jgi:D-methionine transport system substrate-binding protein
MGCYSKKYKDIKSLPNGAKVAIPNDPTNGGRSLMLLEAAGLLKLKDGKGITATPNDLAANPKNLKIIEWKALRCPVLWMTPTWQSSIPISQWKPN